MWAREGLADVGRSGTLLVTTVAMKILAKERAARPEARYFKVLIILVSTQLLVGMVFCAVVYYTTTVTPSLKYKDLPYWASAPLGISGLIGIIYVCRCHRMQPRPKNALTMKVLSFVLSGASIILCGCAVAFLSFHLMTFRFSEGCTTSTHSESGKVICTCRRPDGPLNRRQDYHMIACSDVLTLIKFLFICMCILGCLGGLAAFIYDLLLWTSRYKHVYIQSELPDATDAETSHR